MDRSLTISVDKLTYRHNPTAEASLLDISIHLPKGSRTILIGANGGQSAAECGHILVFRSFT